RRGLPALPQAARGWAARAPGLAGGRRPAPSPAEPGPGHGALAPGQAVDRRLNRASAGAGHDLVLGVGRVRGEEVAEGGLAVVADRLVEARERPRRLADLDDLVDGQLDRRRQLVLGGLAAQLRGELAVRPVDLPP